MKRNTVDVFVGASKYAVGFVFTLVFRLLSPFFGLWNISPLMATELTGSKVYGPWVAGFYGSVSILLLDLLVGKIGPWTLITAITYGAVGICGAYYLKERSASRFNFVIASIFGTLFFDLITGVLMGPLLYDQAWMSAIVGQIPFTLRHLSGNIVFASVFAPWFYKQVMTSQIWNFVYKDGTLKQR